MLNCLLQTAVKDSAMCRRRSETFLSVQVTLAGYVGTKTVQAVLLDKMPESMRKEMEKVLSDAGGERLQPTRLTRKEQALQATKAGCGAASGSRETPSGSGTSSASDHQAVVRASRAGQSGGRT